MNSRKLLIQFECPIDNYLLTWVEYLNPFFYLLGFTPNGLTLVSAIFGIGACINCYYNYYVLASGFHFIGYFFDCADGNFARRYNMVTQFGDIFDHVKDILVGCLLFVVLIYKNQISYYYYCGFIVLMGINNLYLGQQEKLCKCEKSGILQLITVKSNISMKVLRYFGCGTLNLYVSIILFMTGIKNKM